MCQVWAKKQQRCALTLKCALLSALTTPFHPVAALYPAQLFLLHLVVFLFPRRRVASRCVVLPASLRRILRGLNSFFKGLCQLQFSSPCQHTG